MKFYSFEKVEESVAQYSIPTNMHIDIARHHIAEMLEKWHKEKFGKFASVSVFNFSKGLEIDTSSTFCSFDIHEQDTDTGYTIYTIIAHIWACNEN